MAYLKLRYLLLLAILTVWSSCIAAIPATDTVEASQSVEAQYWDQYHSYDVQADYDACIRICDTIARLYPHSARAYEAKSNIYLKEHLWRQAIDTAQYAVSLDPTLIGAHGVIYWAALQISDSKTALAQVAILKQLDPGDIYNADKEVRACKLADKKRVSDICVVLICMVIFLLCLVAWYSKRSSFGLTTVQLVLLPAAFTYVFYLLFYHFPAFVWSGNVYHPAQDYNPVVIRDFTFDHDGREGYILYIMSFAIIGLSVFVLSFLQRFAVGALHYASMGVAGFLSCVLLTRVGFYVPYNAYHVSLSSLCTACIFAIVAGGASIAAGRYFRLSFVFILLLLLPVCFLALGPLSLYDYSYIWSPALRLFHGASIRDVYFQYDLYMSLMALAFFKLGIDIFKFQFVAQAGYYLFFIGLYLFARRFFYDRRLPVLLLVFAVLFRFYANIDPIDSFQVTPWRLDLWLVLVILVYWRGIYHWSVGLFLGLMLIFHRNFGFIYLAAYLQLLLVFSLMQLVRAGSASERRALLRDVVLRCMPPILLIAVGFVVSYIVLGGVLPESALLYQQIGIGMMRISPFSFYWYVPVLLGSVTLLLLRLRTYISERYFAAGVFLLLLTIGNSMYFFGRSHEHNIINLAGILSLCLFLFIDLIGVSIRQGYASAVKRYSFMALPLVCIASVCFFFSDRIQASLVKQRVSAREHKYYYPENLDYDFDRLHQVTSGSDHVFFLDFDRDFLYYYRGHYKPEGYFCPNDAWVLKKDMAAMMQGLLDKGYYIVAIDSGNAREFLPLLSYTETLSDGRYAILHKK